MIKMKLEQKQGFRRQTLEVVGDKLKVKYKNTSVLKEWTVDIESIGREIVTEKHSRKGAILLGGFFLASGIFFLAVNLADREKTLALWAWIAIGLFYLLLGGIIFGVPPRNELHLRGGNSQLTFFLDSPSREEVDQFVSFLISRSRAILLEKYAVVDPDVPEETMMNQLNWLKNIDLLTDSEYDQKKQDYKMARLVNH